MIAPDKSLDLYQASGSAFLWTGGGSLAAGSVVACSFVLDGAGSVLSVKLSSGVDANAIFGPFSSVGGQDLYLAYWLNVAGGETGIVPTTSGAGVRMQAQSFTGLLGGGAFDKGPGNVNNASAADFGAGPVTTTAADEALFAGALNDSGFTLNVNSPYTLVGAVGGSRNAAYRILSATGSYGANIFHMGAASTSTAALLTFKDAAASGSAAITGTGASGATGADVRAGGKTLIVTLTGDTFNAFDNTIRQAIIDGIVAGSSPTWGWNAVRPSIPTSAVVRTSSTVCTITLPALPNYQSNTTLTLSVTTPSTALTGGVAIVATPTIAIARTVTDLDPVGDFPMTGTATRT